MTGLFKAALAVVGIIVAIVIIFNLIKFIASALLSLLFPLLIVGLIAYAFYRLIAGKCTSGTHRIFR